MNTGAKNTGRPKIPQFAQVLKKTAKISLLILLINLLVVAASNIMVESYSRGMVYDQLSKLPSNDVGLVLGTSKYLTTGGHNPFFVNRIDAASRLYHAGKVRAIIVSGDNATRWYNEPLMMKKALEERGVPSSAIYMDFAGFRTLDSVIRAHLIFGQQSITVISQEFHNKRAIYIGRNAGIKIVGFNSDDVDPKLGMKTHLREMLARVKMLIDVHVSHTEPKFLGDPIVMR